MAKPDKDSSSSEYESDSESESSVEIKHTNNLKTKPKPAIKFNTVIRTHVTNDADIIKAMFDAYLTIRITEKERGWTDVKLGSKYIPSNKDVANKLRAITDLVALLPDSDVDYNARQWFVFLTECKKVEVIQHQIKEDTRGSWGGLGKFVAGEEARFEQTLSAIRSYVVSEMSKRYSANRLLTAEIESLSKNKANAEQQYNTAKATNHANAKTLDDQRKILDECTIKFDALVQAGAASDYHEQFFKDFLHRDARLDEKGGPLTENNFAAFKDNVLSRERTVENFENLMRMKSVLNNPFAVPPKGPWNIITNMFSRNGQTAQPKTGNAPPKPKH